MCPQAREVLCSPARASLSVLVLVLDPAARRSKACHWPVLSSRYAIHFKLNIAGRIEFSKKRIRTRIVYYRTGVDRVFGIGIDRSSESERHIHSFSFLFLLLLLLLLLLRLRHYVSTNDWHARTHAQHGHVLWPVFFRRCHGPLSQPSGTDTGFKFAFIPEIGGARVSRDHWQPEDGRKSYCQCGVCTYTVYRVTVHGVQPDTVIWNRSNGSGSENSNARTPIAKGQDGDGLG